MAASLVKCDTQNLGGNVMYYFQSYTQAHRRTSVIDTQMHTAMPFFKSTLVFDCWDEVAEM